MGTKRLFIGTFIDYAIFSETYELLKKHFSSVLSGKWEKPENLHITYKFLGDVSEDDLPAVKEALAGALGRREKIVMTPAGLGYFDQKNPRILYLKMHEPSGALEDVQLAIDDALEPLGFPKETRKFTPHVTLMRIKSVSRDDFYEAVARHGNFRLAGQKGVTVDLIESTLTPQGSIYKKIQAQNCL